MNAACARLRLGHWVVATALSIFVLIAGFGSANAEQDAGAPTPDGGASTASSGGAGGGTHEPGVGASHPSEKLLRELESIPTEGPVRLADRLLKHKDMLRQQRHQLGNVETVLEEVEGLLRNSPTINWTAIIDFDPVKGCDALGRPEDRSQGAGGGDGAPQPASPQPDLKILGTAWRHFGRAKRYMRRVDRALDGSVRALLSDPDVREVGFFPRSDIYPYDHEVEWRPRENCRRLLNTDRNTFKERFELAKTELGKSKRKLTRRQKELQRHIDATEQLIREIEKALSKKGQFSENVINELPKLVGLLGLFSLAIMVMVQRFRLRTQEQWVASGQVTRFMTVTVLVIVVMILGLAKTIEGQVLGTLLGAIAGHVLAQKLNQSQRRPASINSGEGQDAQP